MDTAPIFRSEALQHRQHKQFGSVTINIPVQVKLLILVCAIFVLSVMLFAVCAKFSEHCLVKGYLNVIPHVAKVYAMQPGIVAACYVAEGDTVKRGDHLYRINRFLVGARATSEQTEWRLLKQQQRALRSELAEKRQEVVKHQALFTQHYVTRGALQTQQDALAAVSRQLSQIAVELIRYQQTHNEVVRAPIDGVVTDLLVHVGQRVQPAGLLLSITPHHAQTIAELLVPATFMRFVVPGKSIALRYDAYPYQHYGTAPAVIEQISRTILTDAEEQKPIRLGMPYYKVLASLTASAKALPHGMTFTAVIPGPRKALWRWIFEPMLLSSNESA